MAVQKTHTGIIITKDGKVRKALHETTAMWVVNKTECYRKDTGQRHFGERTRRRLILESVKPIYEQNNQSQDGIND